MPVETMVSIPANYLAIMRSRLKLHGKYNKRKLLVLWTLLLAEGERIPARDMRYFDACRGYTYGALRSTLSRLVKYGYISNNHRQYGLLSKGKRFLYACRELYPDIWAGLPETALF